MTHHESKKKKTIIQLVIIKAKWENNIKYKLRETQFSKRNIPRPKGTSLNFGIRKKTKRQGN